MSIKQVASNIVKGWVTTILGIIIILATIISIFKMPSYITWWPSGFVGIALGVVLVLAPDTIIDLIKAFVKIKSGDTVSNTEPTKNDVIPPNE